MTFLGTQPGSLNDLWKGLREKNREGHIYIYLGSIINQFLIKFNYQSLIIFGKEETNGWWWLISWVALLPSHWPLMPRIRGELVRRAHNPIAQSWPKKIKQSNILNTSPSRVIITLRLRIVLPATQHHNFVLQVYISNCSTRVFSLPAFQTFAATSRQQAIIISTLICFFLFSLL